MSRAAEVDRLLTHGPIQSDADTAPSWGRIAFWTAVWVATGAWIAWCGTF